MHLEFLKRFYPDFEGKKILELGCGRGDFLLECHKEGLDVVGIDINPEYIKISEEKIKKNSFRPHIIFAKGEKLPFENNYFDFVNCVEVLEHTDDPEKVLSEIYRVLDNDGQAFVTVHNRFGAKDAHYKLWFLNWMPRFLGKIYIKVMKKYKDPKMFLDVQSIEKMNYYTYSGFKRISAKTGFSVQDSKENQIYNPELILNRKIKKFLIFTKKIKVNLLVDALYSILNKFYFNTFHLILTKK